MCSTFNRAWPFLIGVKRGQENKDQPLAEVFHADLWGERAGKYATLETATLTGPMWRKLEHRAPHYPLVRRDYGAEEIYRAGFDLADIHADESDRLSVAS
ncbi:MAG: hypothetical protein U5O69_09110 [Candidatus Competibacteraceae bacterium]|nr:hypothetical protein [Candidatus Competibacteraceae bacterium]